jgi:D-amino-acid dehydrogenase
MTGAGRRWAVIGAGIVGLSCAYHLNRAGHEVVLVDRDPEGDRTSFGNAGAVAVAEILPLPSPGIAKKVPGFLFDPLGPLSIRPGYVPWLVPYLRHFLAASRPARFRAGTRAMAALLASAMDDHEALLQTIGASSALNRKGGLFVYRSEQGRARDEAGWQLRREVGLHAEPLDRRQVEEFEPALGPEAACGYVTNDWAHYDDPKALCVGLLAHLHRAGVEVVAAEIAGIDFEAGRPAALVPGQGDRIAFDDVVIAAGAWSHRLSRQLGDPFPLETERGYNTTLPDPGVAVTTMTTFAEDQFVMTPMAMGLRIGGAVEFAGLDAAPDFKRSKALLKLARRYLPGLNTEGGTEWMGHRPSTPDSLPVIGRSPGHANVIYAFGHGHLGLTGSATTGRIVAELAAGRDPGLDLAPFRVSRFR